MEGPPGKGGGGLCGHGGYPRKWGPGGPQQVRIKGLLKKEGDSAQLAKLRMGSPPQERGFSFPGRRRTRTRASHRGSRSS